MLFIMKLDTSFTRFCRNGYGLKVCKGFLFYAKRVNISKLVAYVSNKNYESLKYLKT